MSWKTTWINAEGILNQNAFNVYPVLLNNFIKVESIQNYFNLEILSMKLSLRNFQVKQQITGVYKLNDIKLHVACL